MITEIFFIISFVIVSQYLIWTIGVVLGNGVTLPLPILHIFDQTVTNCYVAYLAIGYQTWFWFNYLNVL